MINILISRVNTLLDSDVPFSANAMRLQKIIHAKFKGKLNYLVLRRPKKNILEKR